MAKLVIEMINGHLNCCVEFEVKGGQQGEWQKSHSNEVCNQNVVPAGAIS